MQTAFEVVQDLIKHHRGLGWFGVAGSCQIRECLLLTSSKNHLRLRNTLRSLACTKSTDEWRANLYLNRKIAFDSDCSFIDADLPHNRNFFQPFKFCIKFDNKININLRIMHVPLRASMNTQHADLFRKRLEKKAPAEITTTAINLARLFGLIQMGAEFEILLPPNRTWTWDHTKITAAENRE